MPEQRYQGLHENGADAEARAMALRLRHSAAPTTVFTYRSGGRVAVVGDGERAITAANQFVQAALDCVLVTGDPMPRNSDSSVHLIRACVASLSGYLGAFELILDADGHEFTPAALLGTAWDSVDLVLDLAAEPLLVSALPPPGYARPEAEDTEAAVSELSALVGEFDKPRFFELDTSLCAHARSGITACTRCLDACPADAIRSASDSIEVDPGLCQGAGVCATACPSGAINYAYPRRSDTHGALFAILARYEESGGANPVVLLHDAEHGYAVVDAMAPMLPGHVVPFELAEVGSLGLDGWLGILAMGAAVAVVLPAQTPASVRQLLHEQAKIAHQILDGLGFDARCLGLIEADTLADNLDVVSLPSPGLPRARFAAQSDKRTALFLAVDHLHQHAPKPRPLVTLDVGAPLGEVTVDQQRCTLCMACVSQCPGRALIAGGDLPALRFVEQNCIQCGMCARSCPENAIAPSPRLLADPLERRRQRTLKEEAPFHCRSCGKAFTTQSMIARVKRAVGTHPMFAGDAATCLEMCDECRVVDIHQRRGVAS